MSLIIGETLEISPIKTLLKMHLRKVRGFITNQEFRKRRKANLLSAGLLNVFFN